MQPQSIQWFPKTIFLMAAGLAATAALSDIARADVYKWEYIDPSNPHAGKRASAVVAQDGAGLVPGPGVDWSFHNLTSAYLDQVDLRQAKLEGTRLESATLRGANLAGAEISTHSNAFDVAIADLRNADLHGANLRDAKFYWARLSEADFTDTDLRGAHFYRSNILDSQTSDYLGRLSFDQLASSASYRQRDLSGIHLWNMELQDADFTNQDLTGASFNTSWLSGASFAGTVIQHASFHRGDDLYDYFVGTGITPAQLVSTASYQSRDLTGVGLSGNDMSGADFAGLNLTDANFRGAKLAAARFDGADIRGADFSINHRNLGSGLTLDQLYSTASYRNRDLRGVGLGRHPLGGADFSQTNLSDTDFTLAVLTDADFSGAVVRGARLGAGISYSQLASTASYQARDLSGIMLWGDLSGWSFADQTLTSASFESARLTDVDFSGADIRGAALTGISAPQLYSTASYQERNLAGVRLDRSDMSGWNFARQNLTGASFYFTSLANADFTDAQIQRADLRFTVGNGLSPAQLYSTASYKQLDLRGINFGYENLDGWNFAGQYLANASFETELVTELLIGYEKWPVLPASFVDADLSGADTRGVSGLDLSGARRVNLIEPNGRIDGLSLANHQSLLIRGYDGRMASDMRGLLPPIPIRVDRSFNMVEGSSLRLILEADEWNSTISFAPGIPVSLGGTLELAFSDDVDVSRQIGRTFRLFDWSSVQSGGAFTVTSRYDWDLTNLYSTGEVTLVAIPEPGPITLIALATCLSSLYRRRKNR